MSTRLVTNAIRTNNVTKITIAITSRITHPQATINKQTLLEHAYKAKAYDVMRYLTTVDPNLMGHNNKFEDTIIPRAIKEHNHDAFKILTTAFTGAYVTEHAKKARTEVFRYLLKTANFEFVDLMVSEGVRIEEVAADPFLISTITAGWFKQSVRESWTIERWRWFLDAYLSEGKNQKELVERMPQLISCGRSLDFIKEMVARVTDVRKLKNANNAPVRAAITHGAKEVLEYLFQNDFVDRAREKALLHLAAISCSSCVSIILREFPDQLEVVEHNLTPFLRAISVGNLGSIKALHAAGCNVKPIDHTVNRAVRLAAEQRNPAILNQVLQYFHPHEISQDDKNHLLIVALEHHDATRVNQAIALGADVHHEQPLKHLILNRTAWITEQEKMVDALLAAGVDINKPNPQGITPALQAFEEDEVLLLIHLLERGANPAGTLPDGRGILQCLKTGKCSRDMRSELREFFKRKPMQG